MSATRTLQISLLVGLVFPVAAMATSLETVHRAWLVATVLLEVLCLALTVKVRSSLEPDEPARATWTLILGFFVIRLLAELRLVGLYFDWMPGFVQGSAELEAFYSGTLRYLYTAADLILIAALLRTLNLYRRLGLQFGIKRADWIVVGIVAAMPMLAYGMRENLGSFLVADDPALVTYRMVAVVVGAGVAIISLGVLRYVTQMGGGAVARVWGAVGVAGVARAASFVVLAVFTSHSVALGDFAEQALLWVFASCWLGAISYQLELAAE